MLTNKTNTVQLMKKNKPNSKERRKQRRLVEADEKKIDCLDKNRP